MFLLNCYNNYIIQILTIVMPTKFLLLSLFALTIFFQRSFLHAQTIKRDTLPPQIAKADSSPISSTSKDTTYVLGIVTTLHGKSLEQALISSSSGQRTVTSNSGGFKIRYVNGEQLTVSSVGYNDTTLMITDPTTFLTIEMSSNQDKHILTDVQVTALGISKNGRSVGYSVSDIKGEAVQTAKETNFVNALQGKIPGVQINTNDGSMGGSTKITIRGNKSITGNNNALFVVDGIFMGNSNPVQSYNQQIGGGGYDYGSPIQDINPDDIEEISVLKGAAATALYGSRGSNGVVLVTTKKGGGSAKLGINYSMNAQMDKVYILPHYQNEYGGGAATSDYQEGVFDTLWQNQNPTYFKNAPTYTDPSRGGYDLMPQYAVDESWGPKLSGQIIRPYYSFDENKGNPYFGVTTPWIPQPNNVRDFFRTGVSITNSVSVGGSNEDGTFRLSYSNLTNNGIMPNSRQMRNNIGFNGTHNFGKYLSAVVSANYSNDDVRGRIGTGFSGFNPMELFSMYSERQLNTNMLKYYEFPDGSQNSWNRQSFSNSKPASATSPYWHTNKDYETDTRSRLYGLAGFDIKPVDWLNISARVFMDKFNTLEQERTAADPVNTQAGAYSRTEIQHQEFNYQLMATAKKDLSKSFNLNATVGGNIMKEEDNINGGSITGLNAPGVYNLSNGISPIIPTVLNPRKQINSLFADATLGYNNVMFLELTGRNDWSSTLPLNHNSYFYPSASYSMIFSNWLSQWKWLSYGKFRASIAQIGSDTDPYETNLAYAAPIQFGNNSYILQSPYLANSNLKPEKSTEVEAGVELKFLNNRLGFDFTAYNRITNGLILPLSISPTTGFTNIYENAGKSRNRGIEIQLTATPVQTKNFAWNTALNFSLNRSKLLSLQIPNMNNDSMYVIGTERRRNSVSTAAIVGQPLYVLTGTDYTYINGQKVIDNAGHYVPSAAGHILGNLEPKYVGGFSNTFTYKSISLSALFDFQQGGSFFSYTNMYGLQSGLLEATVANDIRDKGVDVSGVLSDGTPYSKHLNAADYFKNDFGLFVNKANVYDASYIYLREVTLGWKIPDAWAKAIHASNASLSFYGRNLWLIHSNAPNVDPSNIINSDSNVIGLEGGALPSVRSFGVNLKIGF